MAQCLDYIVKKNWWLETIVVWHVLRLARPLIKHKLLFVEESGRHLAARTRQRGTWERYRERKYILYAQEIVTQFKC